MTSEQHYNARLRNTHLFVVLTTGMSLKAWQDIGMLSREMALYKRLKPSLAGITIVSHGTQKDLDVINQFPGIDLIVNKYGIPNWAYRRVLPLLARRHSKGAVAIFKSNQIKGADEAQRLAQVNNGVFIARCGYLLSDFEARAHGATSSQVHAAETLERNAFGGATQSIVSTDAMRDTVLSYGVASDKITVVPNYVDTDLFSPPVHRQNKRRVIFIGRLSPQKNPLILVEALAGLDAELDVIGKGPLQDQMEEMARDKNIPIRFHGAVPNHKIPDYINDADVFVLPSNYEGHPKTLLEAMSCGIAVVGGNSPGINNVVDHNRTGLLADTNAASLKMAVQQLLDQPDLASALGEAARQEIKSTVSLDRVVEMERAVYEKAVRAYQSGGA